MRCRHCDYLLFHLTRAHCPECGQGFDTEAYRFEPGAVSFHCPHCDQAYFGNDDRGLPVPRAFACAGCGTDVSLQELRVVPERDDALGWIGSVWDNRKLHGLWPAWWRTFKQTALRPTSFYREHVGRSTREAWLFAMISSYIGMVPSMFMQFLMMWAFSSGVVQNALSLPGGAAPPPPPGAVFPVWLFAIMYGFMALVMPLFGPLAVGGIWTLAIQAALAISVPQCQPMGTTFRTTLYSFGTYVMYGVPICGGSVAGVWQIVILINGVKTVHGTTGWLAAIAVLWPIVLLVGLYLLIIALFVGAAFSV